MLSAIASLSFRAKALIADKDVRGPSKRRRAELRVRGMECPTRSLTLPVLIRLWRSLRT
jgi:hypothetical protein